MSDSSNVEIAPEQGRAGLSLPSPINMDWQHPDRDAPRTLHLLVYPPSSPRSTHGRAQSWRDLHWALAWQPAPSPSPDEPAPADPANAHDAIDAAAAWRHVQLDTYDVATDPAPQPRYVYWGARTTSPEGPSPASEAGGGVKRLALATLAREQRRRVEELAWETPVLWPNGRWNCQDWLRALLARMVAEGLVAQENVDGVLTQAETGECFVRWGDGARADEWF